MGADADTAKSYGVTVIDELGCLWKRFNLVIDFWAQFIDPLFSI